MKYLIRDIILYNDKIIINYYFSDPLKKHNNSIESVKETEKQSKEVAPLFDFQSSYKGDNSPPKANLFELSDRFAFLSGEWDSLPVRFSAKGAQVCAESAQT